MSERVQTLRGILSRTNSDERLFERAIRGDSIAFAEFYRRYQPRIFAFCLSRLLDHSLAEEAAQETFVRMLHAQANTVDSPKSWLYGVARNVTMETGRQHAKTSPVEDIDDAFSGAAPDSGQELVRREQGRSIVLALRRMRPRYRTALVMRELHGLTSTEIAEALESTVGAVDTLVSRARDAFGKAYAEVSDLPAECAAVFPLIYKERGTGLDESEQTRLAEHLKTCERCRREARFAEKPQNMAAVLPLLTLVGTSKPTLFAKLLSNANPLLSTVPVASLPAVQATASKAVIAVAITATVAASGVAVMHRPASPLATRTRLEQGVLHPRSQQRSVENHDAAPKNTGAVAATAVTRDRHKAAAADETTRSARANVVANESQQKKQLEKDLSSTISRHVILNRTAKAASPPKATPGKTKANPARAAKKPAGRKSAVGKPAQDASDK